MQRAVNESLSLELEIFDQLRSSILAEAVSIRHTSHVLSVLDVSISMATAARRGLYTRPIVDTSKDFQVLNGRHPIIESIQFTTSGSPSTFIPNDCTLAETPQLPNIYLLTGANMSGKSSFLRQNAIIALMAHIGSFVPASHARIGLVDAIFSRVGSSDDLAKNISSFMVEI